jgi:hypothetical protein
MFQHLTRPVLAGTTAALFVATLALPQHVPVAGACPAGYERRDPIAIAREFQPQLSERAAAQIRSRVGDSICAWRKLPESLTEINERNEDPGRANLPAGALRRAVEQKQLMLKAGLQGKVANAAPPPNQTAIEAAQQAKVANAPGRWKEYGKGAQVSDQAYADGSRDGIPEVAGRVDSFAYDPAGKRLFAAVTYAGVWMSEAKDGDVGTLGDRWVPIGDSLPTLINSAVAWTPAKGGRVLTLTGEHTQGGNTYVGLGGYWSDDLGKTWHHSAGLPDGTGAARLAVDQSNPLIIYAATHRGLFRSTNGGDSFVNVRLPVSEECMGVVESDGPCQLANIVTEVTIRQPGGVGAAGLSTTECDAKGCTVLAAVGYKAGNKIAYLDGKLQSPGNGLYRSDTGEPGTFTKLNPLSANPGDTGGLIPFGFTPQARIGRVEMSAAEGPQQDHNYVYAIVQDAVLLNHGVPVLDLPTDGAPPPLPLNCDQVPDGDPRFVCETVAAGYSPTSINGVYVSPDFGDTWVRLADDLELTYNLATGSSLAGVVALGIGPGVQAWYDLWIKPDPTQAVAGIPTRVLFGMEEVWKNNLNIPVTGLEQTTNDFGVIGTYFAGETCLFLIGNIGPPTPVCPVYDGVINGTTTHPDQHDGIYVPDEQRGGVWVFAGNDGGVYKQYSGDPITDDFANNKWGKGVNQDFYTLFNYGISVAKDGVVYYGLQDNASGKIEGEGGRQVRTYVGDGVYTAVDPNNSKIAYVMTPELAMNRTTDGGLTHTGIAPDLAAGEAHFLSPFRMDPRDPNHLVAAGTKVAELLTAETFDPFDESTGAWTTVFDLGIDPVTETPHQTRSLALAVDGDAVYAGWCGPCNVLRAFARGGPPGTDLFQRGLATNVGGNAPPKKGTEAGWHQASAKGLPNRYIYDIEIDPKDPRTVYVVLGDYSTTRWLEAPQYEDKNKNIGSGSVFKSTDAGENFVNISGNLPDVISTAVIKAGEQLIVGTDIGAFISSDLKGSLWAPLGNLPNVPINELVLDPANPKRVFAATWGRGVQTYTLGAVQPAVLGGRSPAPAAPRPHLPATGVGGTDAGLVLLAAAAVLARFMRLRRLRA